MTDELTEALRATLQAAAQDAPAPQPDLLQRVERRHRSRRRGRAGLAAVAALAVIGGSGAVVSAVGSKDAPDPAQPAMRATPGPLTPAAPPEPVPLERLWPQAVRTVPDRLPGGRRYRPITLLDDTRLLVATESGFEKTDQLLTYDLDARRVTGAIRVPVPSDAVVFPSDFSVGGGHVAWWIKRRTAGRGVIEIWAAPLGGGEGRRVAAMDRGRGQEDVRLLTIGGGKIYWSMGEWGGSPEGVYEVPLSGGPAGKVPGSAGFQVLAWPWIGAPGPSEFGEGKAGDRYHGTLRDLRTGRTQTAALARIPGPWNCGITWCVGYRTPPQKRTGPELESPVYLQRRDGTQGRVLRGVTPFPPEPGLLAYDRFLAYTLESRKDGRPAPKIALYDVQTGKVGAMELPTAKDGSYSVPGPVKEPYDRLFTIDRKDSYVLVDLAKIR
ncbi:hypothetical protein [Thermomonospora sp. CIF 1]|uniref:hypothetical protein n=1 Tax=Thermomonospora sp. CIF 1 TaxID=1916083 RepID=UPI000B1F16EC|nr:hypothetical protein [Thermomonospora sp. CIF 1]